MSEITGKIELWKWQTNRKDHEKKIVEEGIFSNKKGREELMKLWNRKYRLHLPNLFFYLIKPDEDDALHIEGIEGNLELAADGVGAY